MARFDPNTYPDRLAFEANARRLRAAEVDRIWVALALRFDRSQHDLARRVARLGRMIAPYTHRHSTR